MGGGYQYEVKGASMYYLGHDGSFADMNRDQVAIGEVPTDNNPRSKVSISPFHLSHKEVTNRQYRDYLLHDLLTITEREEFQNQLLDLENSDVTEVQRHWESFFSKAQAKGCMPNQECWQEDFIFAYNQPLVDNYFWHPAFDNYPVVGVSWAQANGYCKWLSDQVNGERAALGLSPLPDFRLPTEAEWEYAALGSKTNVPPMGNKLGPVYPWEGLRVWDEKGKIKANIKADHRNYIDDGYEYTAPVGSYNANAYGMYDMGGNVAEWTRDSFTLNAYPEDGPVQILLEDEGTPNLENRVVKGGSWADYRYAAQTGSRCKVDGTKGHARVGFRIARSHID